MTGFSSVEGHAGVGAATSPETDLISDRIQGGIDAPLEFGERHLAAGQLIEAREAFLAVLAQAPDHVGAHLQISRALLRLLDLEGAEYHALRATQLDPGSSAAHRQHGRALMHRQRRDEGVAALRVAVSLAPQSAAVWGDLGEALLQKRDLKAAAEAFTKALELDPNAVTPHVGIAQCLARAGHPQHALKRLRQAPAAARASDVLLLEEGNLLWAEDEFEAAQARYEAALRIRPDWHLPAYALARLAFARGDYATGWRDMLARHGARKLRASALQTARPRWTGAGEGGPLLVWREQGLGEEVLFASMLPGLQALPREKIVSVDPRLVPLFERSLQAPGMRFVPHRGARVPESEYTEHLPMGDLGGYYRTCLEDFERAPSLYLRADPARIDGYARRLRQTPSGPVCGLAWRSRNVDVASEKSLGGRDLQALVTGSGCRFLNLQYGNVPREIESMRALGADLAVLEGLDLEHDIDGLAAAIMACDLIITTSNSTAHIAGALGKRTLLLLPRGRGHLWYWQPRGEGSLWYPSVRILRQERAGDWSGPIAEARRLMEATHA